MPAESKPPKQCWYVYMLECSDNSLYTGITTELQRRVDEHNQGKKAAAYTRSRRPVKLVYSEDCDDRSAALKREHAIKQLSRSEKMRLVSRS